jgi:carbonic anhydrase
LFVWFVWQRITQAETVLDFKYTKQEFWAVEYPLCGNGKEQSPIDLFDVGANSSDKVRVNGYGYHNMKTSQVVRTNETITIPLTGG